LWIMIITVIFLTLSTGCGVNNEKGDTGKIGSNSVTLSWNPPLNGDGSSIKNLKGYKIYYGTKSREYTEVIDVDNPDATTYSIENLPAGTYYFAITAYDDRGIESDYSNEESTTID